MAILSKSFQLNPQEIIVAVYENNPIRYHLQTGKYRYDLPNGESLEFNGFLGQTTVFQDRFFFGDVKNINTELE